MGVEGYIPARHNRPAHPSEDPRDAADLIELWHALDDEPGA